MLGIRGYTIAYDLQYYKQISKRQPITYVIVCMLDTKKQISRSAFAKVIGQRIVIKQIVARIDLVAKAFLERYKQMIATLNPYPNTDIDGEVVSKAREGKKALGKDYRRRRGGGST